MKRIIRLLTAAAVLWSAASLPFGSLPAAAEETAVSAVWDGSSDTSWYDESQDSFTLTTAEQLSGLADLVSDQITMQGKTITLGADILLNDTADYADWGETPPEQLWWYIGESSKMFEGTFDGAGHSIIGMYTPCGLFQFLSEAGEIRDLHLEQCYSQKTLLCARVYGHITDCEIDGVIYDGEINEHNHGGICSSNEGGIIEHCTSNGDYTAYGELGGICGRNLGTIRDCRNNAAVHVRSYTEKIDYGAIAILGDGGGITAKYADGMIENCENTGTISGSGNYNLYVGGIAGTCNRIGGGEMVMRNVHNKGDVDVVCENDRVEAAGIIGDCPIPVIRLEDVSNSGAITMQAGDTSYVGGILGHMNKTALLDHVWNTGTIHGTSDSHCVAGGIAAFINLSDSVLQNVYNTGDVTAESLETRKILEDAYRTNAGGIVGAIIEGITLRNLYNTGTVTAKQYAGAIYGRSDDPSVLENCWYLENGSQADTDGASAIGSEAMCTPEFAETLGDAFCYAENTHPVLRRVLRGGDLDGDAAVSVSDLVRLQRYLLLADGALTQAQAASADLNADGAVDVFDLSLLKRALLSA